MRSSLAVAALGLVSALALSACSYYYEIHTEAAGTTVHLDDTAPSKSYRVQVCVTGPHAEHLDVTIKPWSSDEDAALTTVEVGDSSETLGPRDAEISFYLELEDFESFDEACNTGALVSFNLDPAATGEVAVEWDIEARASSDYNEELEGEIIEIMVEEET